MDECWMAVLQGRAVLRVDGEAAQDFLNGLVSARVSDLQPGKAVFAGLLSPQGKLLFDFHIVRVADGFLLDCHAEMAGELAKRLGFYRLRAKVGIEGPLSDMRVGAVWGAAAQAPQDGGLIAAWQDPRLVPLGWRFIAPEPGIASAALGACALVAEADYHTHRIALGVPEGGLDYEFGAVFAHDACLDLLGGVDFNKGCYVGQEVVSRMHHRGTARKRVVIVTANEPLQSGMPVNAGEKSLGVLGSVAGHTALALVRIDRAGDALAGGQPITAGGVRVALRRPDWAGFDLPEPAPAAAS
jgi:folate-binding protein YgfZ